MRVLRTENPLATFDVNEFSDLTEKEFNDRMTGWVPAPMDNVEEFIPNGTFADDIDWRSKNAITPKTKDHVEVVGRLLRLKLLNLMLSLVENTLL